MNNHAEFTSQFAEYLTSYVALMLGAGRAFRVERTLLRAFDRYVIERSFRGHLTQELVVDFAYAVPNLTPTQYKKRHHVVRCFAQYLRMLEPATETVAPIIVSAYTGRYIAHIYTPDELTRLLDAAGSLTPVNSLRPLTHYTIIGSLASAGLRAGEITSLDIGDVDLQTGVIHIRNTKFRKSRLVPVHDTTLDVLRDYDQARRSHFSKPDCQAFFRSNRGTRLSYSSMVATFIQLARQIGIRDEQGKGPRLHDLRHTFAVRRVQAWYEAGEDVQLHFPELATYMGHAHFRDTLYYLTAGAELMAKGAERFERDWRNRQ